MYMFNLLLLLIVLLESIKAQQCSTEPACYGCRSTGSAIRVTCAGGQLTNFPQLPVSVQPRVDELVLRSNSISEITARDLQNYTSLETLDLSLNSLSSIEEDVFRNNNFLMELDLRSNNLRWIPKRLFQNTQLNTLDLENNLLENVTADTFTGLQDFSRVDLGNNLIRTLPSDVFTSIGILDELILSGNPLVCDCHLRWVPSFLGNLATRPLIYDFGTCRVPVSNLTGVSVDTLTNEDDFECICYPDCVYGECNMTVGECACDPGYYGIYCEIIPSETRSATLVSTFISIIPTQTLSSGVRTVNSLPTLLTLISTPSQTLPILLTKVSSSSSIISTNKVSLTVSTIQTPTPGLPTGVIAGLTIGGALLVATVLMVIAVILITLICFNAQKSRNTRRVAQSLIQDDSEDTPLDSREEKNGEICEEGRVQSAYLKTPSSPYEAVLGKTEDVTTPFVSIPHSCESDPKTLNTESKCSLVTSL